MKVALLAGGTGGAMLAEGLDSVLPAGSLTVITNTGDDLELYGLAISPDTDAVLYRLAGIFNEKSHWGVEGETFAMLEMLKRYGEDTWFGSATWTWPPICCGPTSSRPAWAPPLSPRTSCSGWSSSRR
jgi:2-phospho-L-lactate transferase/gluconeogenesis factor (CofD/UPF0052 family)